MKKLLSILSTIAFTASTSSAVVSCNLKVDNTKDIDKIIKNKDLGKISNVSESILKSALKQNNPKVDTDKLALKDVDLFNGNATFVAKNKATDYDGEARVTFDFGNRKADSQYLWEAITNTWLGTIASNDAAEILKELKGVNPLINTDELEVKAINPWGATIEAKSNSTLYKGQSIVSYNVINGGDSSAVALYSAVKNSWLGEIQAGSNEQETEKNILNQVKEKNSEIDINELEVKSVTEWGAQVVAKSDSTLYRDECYISFTLKGNSEGSGSVSSLYNEVKTTWLGNISDINEATIMEAVKRNNPNLDTSKLTLKNTNDYNSILIPNEEGKSKYKDEVWLSYSVSENTKPVEKKELSQVITKTNFEKNKSSAIHLSEGEKLTELKIKELIDSANKGLDLNQVEISNITETGDKGITEEFTNYSATVKAKENSYSYKGTVDINFYTVVSISQPDELNDIIKNTQLGDLNENTEVSILSALAQKNANLDLGHLEVKNITETSATINSISGSKIYKGSVEVNFKVIEKEKPSNKKDLSVDLTEPNLGEIKDANISTILEAVYAKNKNVKKDEVEVKNISTTGATIKAKAKSEFYTEESQVVINFSLEENGEKPKPSNDALLVGYWYEWGGANQHNNPVDLLNSNELLNSAYNVIDISFLYTWEPYAMPTFEAFSPGSETRIKEGIKSLQNAGKKVILSMGGATGGEMRFRQDQTDQLTATFIKYMDDYGFDGIDIDWEGGALGDRESQQTTISALKEAKKIQNSKGKEFMITMAPELPYLKYNTEGGNQGSYIPFLKGLDGLYDFINPQYYNGWAFGPFVDEEEKNYLGISNSYISNDEIEYRGEFYYLVTKYLTTKYSAQNDFYEKIPTNKFVLGAATNEPAGRGAATRESIYKSYVLLENDNIHIRGLMTWAINYDAVSNWMFETWFKETWGNK
ncbi:glycosyl hydrolase family 18 protein [Spiroplasma endosymbiont of Cantharis rufa]|uniref:glycosyl hydrolase family 18 protein n=1 Tax=Spiroplasma endosymbiont of Cantharis rufa TaxID=3066279 RepID=UPI0030D24A6E